VYASTVAGSSGVQPGATAGSVTGALEVVSATVVVAADVVETTVVVVVVEGEGVEAGCDEPPDSVELHATSTTAAAHIRISLERMGTPLVASSEHAERGVRQCPSSSARLGLS
jgi:hypothetical protein